MALRQYHLKRNFEKTPEPVGKHQSKIKATHARLFVIQKHAARRLHYDFRLELGGVLKSWAVPKGPSLNPQDKRLAVHVEDHPFEYKDFEGIIPAGEYGGGTVLLWDQGTWGPQGDPEEGYQKGSLKFQLNGKKLKGGWALFKMSGKAGGNGKNWLLVKEKDQYASTAGDVLEKFPKSVQTDRSMEMIAKDQDQVWSGKKRGSKSKKTTRLAITPPKARPAPLPNFIRPQLAALSSQVPEGDQWLHEIKFDGYRAIAWVKNGKARLWTRNENDWTARFSLIAKTVSKLPVEEALLDGEIVKLLPDGTSNFQALQNSLREGKTENLYYYVFDLLHWNHLDLRSTPLEERKKLLEKLLHSSNHHTLLRFSESFFGEPNKFYREACHHALEGIISKRRDLGYISGRNRNWLKIKCIQRQEFIIVGFTAPSGRRSGFGALVLGVYDKNKQLHYAGLVGTGFTHSSLLELHAKLLKLKQDSAAVTLPKNVRLKGVQWVKPKLVAEVEFTEWTQDNLLRHPSFEGLREDKSPLEVIREEPKSVSSEHSENGLAGVHITHPDKIIYAKPRITKWGLAQYYEEIAEWILPHLKDRPLSLLRCPDGSQKKCFYQKHLAQKKLIGDLKTVPIQEKHGKTTYVIANNVTGLFTLVQIGVLEIHPWGSQYQKLEFPDRMIFDLDPDPSVKWKEVIGAAKLLRLLLEELRLKSFLKTTGGKGLHIVVPLAPQHSWKEVKEFSKTIAAMIVNDDPDHFTDNPLKARRKGRIFLDYLRNDRGSTSIAPYSTRAYPSAPVSTPLFWDELDLKIKSDHFNVKNLQRRLTSLKNDPWEGIFNLRQLILAEAKRKLGMK